MRPRLFHIPAPLGKLAILPRPRPGDWLADEIAGWRTAGVTTVVSLLEQEESEFLELEDEPAAVRAAGLRFLSFPVPDHSVPENRAAFLALADKLVGDLKSGESVGIHCRAGIGRSGVLAAVILMKLGVPMDTALASISAARNVPVPDTREQAAWLSTLELE